MDGAVRVLHVEDDSQFADLTVAFLERDDHIEIATASDATEGLAYLADNEVDCIVSDYDMPGANGVEFLETVREDHPDLPFILFTGKGSEEVAAEAVEADVSGYLQKGSTDTFDLLVNRIHKEVADYRRATSFRRYRTVVESLTDPVYVLDEVGGFTDVNDAFCELTGYDRGAIIGNTPALIKDETELDRAEKHLRRILSSDGPDDARFELEIETADGETVICEDHMGVIPFEGDQFRGSVGTLRDITARKRSERYRRELYEVAGATDLGFEEKCERMLDLGRKRLDIAGGKLVRTEVAADTHETVVSVGQAGAVWTVAVLSKTYCRRVVQAGSSVALHDAEATGWGDDPAYEEYGHACYTGAEVTVDGKQYGTVCFFGPEPRAAEFTDAELTFVELIAQRVGQELERKRAHERLKKQEAVRSRVHEIVSDRDLTDEERLRALVRLGRDILDVEYGIISQVDGDQYRIDVLDATSDAMSEGDVLPLAETPCERTVAERRTDVIARLGEDEKYADHPAHTDFGYECYIGAPVYEAGELYGTLCFLGEEAREREFTGMETTFVELVSQWASYMLTERANREALTRQRDRLEQFAGVVSHDLRGPLNVARGRIELEQANRDSEHLASALEALDRAQTLIGDLLALSREGEHIGNLEPVDIAAIARDTWDGLAPGDATLMLETDRTIRADDGRVRQLVGNIFRNAVEHAGNEVTVTVGDCDGGFYIADDGPGIPSEERDQVFETGYTTAEDGTGFGLAIVDAIATAHGWTVDVTTSESGGTRVEFIGIDD